MDIVSLWDKTLQLIKGELSPPSFNAFFKQIIPLKIHMNELILLVPNDFTKGILEDRYLNLIESSINQLSLKKYKVKFVLDEKYVEGLEEEPKSSNIPQKNYPNLNPKYTFDTFVIGNSNRFAHAACVAVAESPGTLYNPLFIYGGAGLGKTHLMQSIAHYILRNDPSVRVLYVTSETFTNDLIDSLKGKKNAEFKEKYRSIDVLMIDDIQFLIGKESTQEEFFHTFNYLYETGKQVIITSDKPPKDFTNLEERLRSRFSVGLPVDVSAPDYETRVAILHKKEETENTKISDDIINYIAENINTNIRELEGALNRITAFKRLSNKEITLNMAEDVLRDIINNHKEVTITVPLIVEVIASHFGFEADELLSQKRNKDIAYSRQIAMYLCRQMTDLSLQQIGKELGNRDHTTVRHGIEKITEDLKNSQFLQDTIDVLQKKINPALG